MSLALLGGVLIACSVLMFAVTNKKTLYTLHAENDAREVIDIMTSNDGQIMVHKMLEAIDDFIKNDGTRLKNGSLILQCLQIIRNVVDNVLIPSNRELRPILLSAARRAMRLNAPSFRLTKTNYQRIKEAIHAISEESRFFTTFGEYDIYENDPLCSLKGDHIIVKFSGRFGLCLFIGKIFVVYYMIRPFMTMLWRPIGSRIVKLGYLISLPVFFLRVCLIKIRNLKKFKAELENKTKLQAFNDYYEAWFPESDAHPAVNAWPKVDLGYFLFKSLEGHQFRKALELFPPMRPSCEFGVDEGSISALHLKALPFIDVGCEVVRDKPVQLSHRFGKLLNCAIEDFPYPPETFSSVFLIHIVDHIPHLESVFKRLHQIVKRGGRVYFSGCSIELSDAYANKFCQGLIHNAHSREWYEQLCAKTGFKVLYHSYMQTGLAARIWKTYYPFVIRTNGFREFLIRRWMRKWSHRYMRFFIPRLSRPLFLLDEALCEKRKKGLNFMMVMEKE